MQEVASDNGSSATATSFLNKPGDLGHHRPRGRAAGRQGAECLSAPAELADKPAQVFGMRQEVGRGWGGEVRQPGDSGCPRGTGLLG